MGPKRKPSMANDAIDPTDSTFEDHWDKLESKLNEWVKSSLPGIVTSIMQSGGAKVQVTGHRSQVRPQVRSGHRSGHRSHTKTNRTRDKSCS